MLKKNKYKILKKCFVLVNNLSNKLVLKKSNQYKKKIDKSFSI